jgi:hypothetical protein
MSKREEHVGVCVLICVYVWKRQREKREREKRERERRSGLA